MRQVLWVESNRLIRARPICHFHPRKFTMLTDPSFLNHVLKAGTSLPDQTQLQLNDDQKQQLAKLKDETIKARETLIAEESR